MKYSWLFVVTQRLQSQKVKAQPKKKSKLLLSYEVCFLISSYLGIVLLESFLDEYFSNETLPLDKIIFYQPINQPENRLANQFLFDSPHHNQPSPQMMNSFLTC